MVAYSFKARFVDPILSGRKRQTIRAQRRRHAREGEALQLYTGMRTKACRLIGRAVCLSVSGIKLALPQGPVTIRTPLQAGGIRLTGLGSPLGNRQTTEHLEKFAQADGFESFAEMVAFWAEQHPGIECFEGVLIRWADFAPAGDWVAEVFQPLPPAEAALLRKVL